MDGLLTYGPTQTTTTKSVIPSRFTPGSENKTPPQDMAICLRVMAKSSCDPEKMTSSKLGQTELPVQKPCRWPILKCYLTQNFKSSKRQQTWNTTDTKKKCFKSDKTEGKTILFWYILTLKIVLIKSKTVMIGASAEHDERKFIHCAKILNSWNGLTWCASVWTNKGNKKKKENKTSQHAVEGLASHSKATEHLGLASLLESSTKKYCWTKTFITASVLKTEQDRNLLVSCWRFGSLFCIYQPQLNSREGFVEYHQGLRFYSSCWRALSRRLFALVDLLYSW